METDELTSEIHQLQILMKDEEMKMQKYKVNVLSTLYVVPENLRQRITDLSLEKHSIWGQNNTYMSC